MKLKNCIYIRKYRILQMNKQVVPVLHNYSAITQDELTVNAGDMVELLVPSDNDWSYVRKNEGTPGEKGWVPTSYLRVA